MNCRRILRTLGGLAAVALIPISRAQTPAPPPHDWCEIIENAAEFDGKEIEVRATYRTRFETSELHCLGCKAGGRAWVDFKQAVPFPAPLRGMNSGTANVIFKGRFHTSGGPFGHLGQYKFLFEATAVQEAEKIEPSGFPPDALPAELAAKVCGAKTATTNETGAGKN